MKPKKIIILQVQFMIVFVHTLQIQFQPSCRYPKLIGVGLTLNASLFIYLFSSFYIQSYNKNNSNKALPKQNIKESTAIKQD